MAAFIFTFSTLLLNCHVLLTQGVIQMSHEKRLIRDLIGNYSARGKMGRPVQEQNDTITILYGMSLIQILDLDERNQVLSTNVWATYNWNDMYLQWNESDYGNINTVRVNSGDIWTPDVKLYNYGRLHLRLSARHIRRLQANAVLHTIVRDDHHHYHHADVRLEEKREALCVLSSNGNVVWIPQAVFKSSCSIDIRHFPFDVQKCHLKFGSWTYDGSKLDLQFHYNTTTGFELTDYILSNEWDIEDSTGERNVKYYPCCPEPYVDLVFRLVIRRKVAFYNYILILPCVLLSSLTLVLFWLPPESPAKMQLGMNIFVAFFVLLLLLAESTPPAASSIPLIGAYYCLNMILITLSTLLSVVIVNLYFHGPGTKVPRIFRKLMLDFFAKVLCMQNTLMDKRERDERRNSVVYNGGDEAMEGGTGPSSNASCNNVPYVKPKDRRHVEFKYDRVGVYELQPEENWKQLTNGLGGETDPPERINSVSSQFGLLEAEVREIKRHLKRMADKNAEKANKEYLAREWKLVALVLDRLFFFIYLVAIVVSAVTLFQTPIFQAAREDARSRETGPT